MSNLTMQTIGPIDARHTCIIKCTDVVTTNSEYREVQLTVNNEECAIVWYNAPSFRDDATLETALQSLALALGARVTNVQLTRDERQV